MDAAAQHLLDFSKDLDIDLLDQIVLIAMDPTHPQRSKANDCMIRLKENPDMWKRADAILEKTRHAATRFFGLQILGDLIETRWKILPVEQREGIRNYVVAKIINLSSSKELLHTNRDFLPRLNIVLVSILKQDWPHNWPTFITELVEASKRSESLCENNMQILQLLSEDVFDFSMDSMTAAKAKALKESLNEEFSQIFQLCLFILEVSQMRSLLTVTLQTLQRFLSWIPLGYIFETNIVHVLVNKFFPAAAFRTNALDCLTEIASLTPSDIPESYHPILQRLLVDFIPRLKQVIPLSSNLAVMYENGSHDECLFVARLALFLSTFLMNYIRLFETAGNPELEGAAVEALSYLVIVSEVRDDEIFKTCLEFWHHWSKELYSNDARYRASSLLTQHDDLLMGNSGFNSTAPRTHGTATRYDEVLHRLRIVMIDRMAKPEEVIIVEDENGEIVREVAKDTEVIAQYKTMREAIIYLTHLNYDDTEQIMLAKLELQVDGGQFSWNGLNTLCWAIGSISGAMSEIEEKRFLVTVIRDLLRLCEEQRGKDNKAVVASNIMYIVGQYPRFLRAHWKFLKTVVNKLFEFMHEYHPGVQDMACDTFLKIAQKCKRKFMTLQLEETQPFILTLIGDLSRHINDLQSHQVQAFFEAVACMLSDKGPAIRLARDETVVKLMEIPNESWASIMAEGGRDIQYMLQLDVMKDISRIVRINAKVCSAAGSVYIHQLSTIYMDMLNVYRLYSERLSTLISQRGEVATRETIGKAMRGVKSEILDLMTAFIEVSKENDGVNGPQTLMNTFIPPLMREVLNDYRSSVPAARDYRVLTLFATAVAVIKEPISSCVPAIMDAVFESTLEMITKNMMDFPDHRIGFFRFLREANEHCFYGLFSIPPHQQKLIVDSVVWAFKHTERNISETGLEILLELLQNVSRTSQVAQPFYQQFLLPLIQDILGVMTDRLHKSGFKLHAAILKHLFYLLQTNQVTCVLYDSMSNSSSNGTAADNQRMVSEYVVNLLTVAFPNVTKSQVYSFVRGLFDINLDLMAFKQHLRDFLITVKEFAAEDNTDLFFEENEARKELERQQQYEYRASVPGLLTPAEALNDMDDL